MNQCTECSSKNITKVTERITRCNACGEHYFINNINPSEKLIITRSNPVVNLTHSEGFFKQKELWEIYLH